MKQEPLTDMQAGKRLFIRLSWLLAILLALLQVVFNTDVQTDISGFMPSANSSEQAQLLEEIQHGSAARTWLIAVQGTSPDADAEQLTSASQKLAKSLRDSGLFSPVLNGPAATGDGDLTQLLFSYRYLLDDTISKDSFSESELRKALQQRIADMASPFSSFSKKLLVSDPTASMLSIDDRLQGSGSDLETHAGTWYSSQARQALLIASSSQPGNDIDAQQQAYRQIQDSFDQVARSAGVSLIVSGPPLFAVVARDSIRNESRRLSIAATVFMLLFMFLVFRNVSLVLLSMLPLATGMLLATAVVSMLFGGIHGITLAFGITLLGVAIDYPVHLFLHARADRTLQQAAMTIWPVLKLGVLTTALGYGAMIWTDFNGLSQLGVFSLVGLIVAALATRTLLPALRQKMPADSIRMQGRLLSFMAGRWKRYAGLSLAVLLVAGLFGLAANRPFQPADIWSQDVAALSPVPAELIQQDRQLRSRSGLPEATSMIRIHGQNVEEVLEKEELLEPLLKQAVESGIISSCLSAARLVPSMRVQQQRQSSLPPRETLSRSLDTALQGLPFKAGSFEPFLQAVDESGSLALLTPAEFHGTAIGTALNGLLSNSEQGVTGAVRLHGLTDIHAMEKLITKAALPGVTFLNIKSGTNTLIEDFRKEMLSRIGWVSVVIVLVLLTGLNSFTQSIKVIVPVMLAVLFAAVVPLWMGEALTLFHLVSLLLVAGLGLDYALFFSSIRDDQSNAATVVYSLVICSISSLAVFAMLAVSSIPVLHAIGVTVASGVIAAFIFSWWLAGGRLKVKG